MKKIIKVVIMIILICTCLCANTVNADSNKEQRNSNEESIGKLIKLEKKQTSELDDYIEKYNSDDTGKIAYIINKVYVYMIPFTYLIIITCIVSLILNCIRKNVGKIIFSVIGFIIPIITYAIMGLGKLMFLYNESMGALIIFISAIIVNIILEILAIIFCIQKNNKEIKL